MRKTVLSLALAAAFMGLGNYPSKADIIANIGDFSTNASRSFGHVLEDSGTFADQFTFSLASNTFLNVDSVTNAFADASQYISNFYVKLFEGSPVGIQLSASGAPILTMNGPTLDDGGRQDVGISRTIGPGSYYLEVGGTVADSDDDITASYGGSFNIKAIPEASTWAMLLLGFATVGFTAYRRKGRNADVRLA